MAWNNLAGVGNLLATLGQLQGVGQWQQKGAKGKGAHKGGGKAKGKGKGSEDGFQCLWDDCQAAAAHQVTVGKPCCHKCGRAKGVCKSPPLERLIKSKYESSLLLQKNGGKASGKGQDSWDTNGKNKAATTATPPRTQAAVADAEKLAELRAERLWGLKEASGDSSGGAPQSHSSKPATGNKKEGSTLNEGALESAPLLRDLLKPVIELVAADWIAEVPVGLDPEEGLKTVLQASSNLTVADGREALEACLAESRQLLQTTTAPAIRKYLQTQIEADSAALEKSGKRATPSLATQLAALQEAEKKLLMQSSER